MSPKPDPCTCNFLALALLKHLNALEIEVDGVYLSEDIECVHRMRVASRRLRNAFDLSRECLPQGKASSWLRNIRRITRALGAARDTDVQMQVLVDFSHQADDPRHIPGLRRLNLRISQVRHREQKKVVKALDGLKQSAAIPQLKQYLDTLKINSEGSVSCHLYQHACKSIVARLDTLFSYEPFIHKPECVAELHAMRIAAKWLRYTLEVFSPLYSTQLSASIQASRKMQELLGAIHDCDVWLIMLPAFLTQERQRMQDYLGHTRPFYLLVPGIEAFQQDRLTERQRLYTSFLKNWEKVKARKIWDELHETINLPLIQGEVYPPSGGFTSP
jgi:CHAD domain-containing protein